MAGFPVLAGNGRRDLAVWLIDVDQLSQLNERHGRANGDRALIAVADARGPGYRVTVSVGIAAGTGASTNAAALLRRAESALYGAKCGGRNRVELAEGA